MPESVLYGTRSFISMPDFANVFTTTRRWSLSRVTKIQSTPGRDLRVRTHIQRRGAESGLAVTPPPVAIMSPSKIQRRMLSVESGYFKWHFFTNSNHRWVYPLLNERNELLPSATDISSHSLSVTPRL